VGPPTASERSLLVDQVANAKAAMVETMHGITNTLERLGDPRACARRHPWLAAGSAMAAGFVTGAVSAPSKEELIRKVPTHSEAEGQPSGHVQEAPRTKKSLLFAAAASVLAGVLQTVVRDSIASAVAAKPPPLGEVQGAQRFGGNGNG